MPFSSSSNNTKTRSKSIKHKKPISQPPGESMQSTSADKEALHRAFGMTKLT